MLPCMRPQVVAHRGASHDNPEHTLGAYLRALEVGADALECDVRLTADGHLICVHDRDLRRTAASKGAVSTMRLADLDELDFASWKARQEGTEVEEGWQEAELDPERCGVLTLERLLQLAHDSTTPSGDPVQLHIETKHPTRYGGLVERALIALLHRYGLASPLSRSVSQVTVMSYALTSLRRVHALAPVLPTVLLMDRVPVRFRDGRLPLQVSAAGVALPVLKKHPGYVQRVHGQGGARAVFTVDEPDDIELVLGLGADMVISNQPGRVQRRLAERR